jgi:hypothetical protein
MGPNKENPGRAEAYETILGGWCEIRFWVVTPRKRPDRLFHRREDDGGGGISASLEKKFAERCTPFPGHR